MARKASFFVSVNDVDVTGNFTPYVTDISITDGSGKSSDTASISIADDGTIAFPDIGVPVSIGIGWGIPVLLFSGTVDDVSFNKTRGGGKSFSISAKSADTVKGKVKQQASRHKDDSTFGDVAKEWGQAHGLTVNVHPDLAAINRTYWSMNNESFAAWGERMARQLAATFKIMGSVGIFVPRSAGISPSGAQLADIEAIDGKNLIDCQIKPNVGRPQHKKFKTRHFDADEGEWQEEEEDPEYETGADAETISRYIEADKETAKSRAKSNAKKSDRERGGGTVTIDGDPSAQAEARLKLIGVRAGIDGTYRIDSVTHRYSRGGGFTSSCSVKQPTDGAGKDDR